MRLTLAEAFRRDGPTSSTSISYTVRFSPSLVSYDRCRSRPETITRMPRVSDSATFSAACRHTLQVRNRLSPSFHSLVFLSRNLGVEATRNRATGWPAGVKRSSGSSTRLPAIVIWVSPAAMGVLRSVVLGPGDLGPQNGLVQVELAVEFEHDARLRRQVDDRVVAFRLLLDRVGQAALAPDVGLLDLAAAGGHDLEEPLKRRLHGPLLEVRVEDDHDLVMAHGRPESSSGLVRPRSFRGRRCRGHESGAETAGWSAARPVYPTSSARGNRKGHCGFRARAGGKDFARRWLPWRTPLNQARLNQARSNPAGATIS